MTSNLPDYNPHLLEAQVAVVREMQRRGWYASDDEAEREIARLQAEHNERRAKFIEAGYREFDIPRMEQEFHTAMTRKDRNRARRNRRWLYAWNVEPDNDPYLGIPLWWRDDTEQQRARQRKQAELQAAMLHHVNAEPIEWLWPGRLPVGKVSLLTGDAGEGKSLIALDVIARVTSGRDWPDGRPNTAAGNVLLIAPDAGLHRVLTPRLHVAGADLYRLQHLTAVVWNDRETGEPDRESFKLPVDGPVFEQLLDRRPHVRLLVIDPLSEFLSLPPAARERESALHEILCDLVELAEEHRLAILCVETARPGGLIGTASRQSWRAHYDDAFQTVWGAARDPRDRERRLLLPIRNHLGDDRSGLRFSIEPGELDAARIEWGQPEGEITYAEATGRVRLGRGIWSFSQTAQAESWLRDFLKNGPKRSVEIFSAAREQGFTENPVRDALRRVASKRKQGYQGVWKWRLMKTEQISRDSSKDAKDGKV